MVQIGTVFAQAGCVSNKSHFYELVLERRTLDCLRAQSNSELILKHGTRRALNYTL